MSLCVHVPTTNITSFLRRQINVLFMSFVTMSLCSYFASVNQVYCAFQNILASNRKNLKLPVSRFRVDGNNSKTELFKNDDVTISM